MNEKFGFDPRIGYVRCMRCRESNVMVRLRKGLLVSGKRSILGGVTKEILMFNFKNWAQPVTNRKWAVACVLLDSLKRLSRNRLFLHSSHAAWERACGLR